MKKSVQIIAIIACLLPSALTANYDIDSPEYHQYLWEQRLIHRAKLKELEICNDGQTKIKLSYARYNFEIARIIKRMRTLRPGEKVTISVLKDESLRYQVSKDCSEGCKKTGQHSHWSKKTDISLSPKSKSVVVGQRN